MMKLDNILYHIKNIYWTYDWYWVMLFIMVVVVMLLGGLATYMMEHEALVEAILEACTQ